MAQIDRMEKVNFHLIAKKILTERAWPDFKIKWPKTLHVVTLRNPTQLLELVTSSRGEFTAANPGELTT